MSYTIYISALNLTLAVSNFSEAKYIVSALIETYGTDGLILKEDNGNLIIL